MFTKKVMHEVDIIDVDTLKVGTKIYFKSRSSFSDEDFNDPEGGFWEDEGEGTIRDINEFSVALDYWGYAGNMMAYLNIDDLNSGFYYIRILP